MFKALADETRLRLVLVLTRGPFSVQELTEILAMSQPRISRHLRILSESGLAVSRREGAWVNYWLDLERCEPLVRGLLEPVLGALAASERGAADLREVAACKARRTVRTRSFFDRVADRWRRLRSRHVDEERLSRILRSRVPRVQSLADLGCGAGEGLRVLADRAQRLIAVDHSVPMIELARRSLAEAGVDHVEFRLGELDHLPLRDGEVDVAVMSLVLHHAANPPAVLLEVFRVLRTGGRLLLVDLAFHGRDWMREELGDQWLGFDPEELRRWLLEAGYAGVIVERQEGGPEAIDLLLAEAARP